MQAFTSRLSLVLVALALISPASAFAQLTKAGGVTTLQGSATVTRASLSQPQHLKFRDDVFVKARVVSGDASVARTLPGGKAIAAVRERSSVTISESPGVLTGAAGGRERIPRHPVTSPGHQGDGRRNSESGAVGFGERQPQEVDSNVDHPRLLRPAPR